MSRRWSADCQSALRGRWSRRPIINCTDRLSYSKAGLKLFLQKPQDRAIALHVPTSYEARVLKTPRALDWQEGLGQCWLASTR